MQETSFSIKKIIRSFNNWKYIWNLLFHTNKGYFLLIVSLTIISGLIPSLVILATESVIISIENIDIVDEVYFKTLLGKFFIFGFLVLLSPILNSLLSVLQMNYQVLVVNNINWKIANKSIQLSYEDFENPEIYDNLQRARQGAANRPYQIFENIIGIGQNLITFISVVGILILWKWWSVLLILFIPFMSSFSMIKIGNYFFKINYNRAKKQRKQFYYFNLLTIDKYVKEIRLYNLGNILAERFRTLQNKFYSQDKKVFFKKFRIEAIFTFISIIVIIFLQWLMVRDAVMEIIAIGSLVAYFQAIQKAQSSSQELMEELFSIYENNLFVNELFKFLHLTTARNNNFNHFDNKLKSHYSNVNQLEFKDVSFKYPGTSKYVLKNVSFKIKKGETIALVGNNGSGKSTIIKLICKLYYPTTGEILYNGISINNYTDTEWYKKIGVMFQDFVQYELPVYENVGFGNWPELHNLESIQRATKFADADTLVNSLPEHYYTQLGKWFEEGIQLSGGQWQKMGISRAYMKDSNICMLDEPTAALDPQSEIRVFKKFKSLAKNKIGIFISHRYSTVRYSTKIMLFEKGKLIEEGTHEELINLKEKYFELYQAQLQSYLRTDNEVK